MKRQKSLWIAAIIVICIAVAGTITMPMIWASPPIPREASKGLGFPLYHPSNLPEGFSVDQSSFTQRDKVLIFSIRTPDGQNIAVAEQARPNDLDLGERPNPSGAPTPDDEPFGTGLGRAHIMLWGEKTVISLPTEKTWIILNITDVPKDDARAVARAFQKVE